MGYPRLLLCLTIVIAGVTAPTFANTAADDQSANVEGIILPLTGPEEQQLLADAREAGITGVSRVYAVMNRESTTLVFTDRNVSVGEAVVEGRVLGEEDGLQLMLAASVSVDTNPEVIPLQQLLADPSQYAYQLVQVRGRYQQASYTLDVGEGKFQRQLTTGALTNGTFFRTRMGDSLGQQARWGTLTLSNASESVESFARTSMGLTIGGNGLLTISHRRHHWWVNGTATVKGVVLTRPIGSTPGSRPFAQMFVTDIKSNPRPIDGSGTIQRQGEELVGEVVSFRAQLVGGRISSKQTLLELARCAPDTVVAPGIGCGVPLVTDTAIHAGVLYEDAPSNETDVVYYAGLSNEKLDQQFRPTSGTYQVTGRVVPTERLSPRLPSGRAVVVRDLERLGGLSRPESRQTARAATEQFRSALRKQINGSTAPPRGLGALRILGFGYGSPPAPGDDWLLQIRLENPTNRLEKGSLNITVNGELRHRRIVELGLVRKTRIVEFNLTVEEPGTYNVSVNGMYITTLYVDSDPVRSPLSVTNVTMEGEPRGEVPHLNVTVTLTNRGVENYSGPVFLYANENVTTGVATVNLSTNESTRTTLPWLPTEDGRHELEVAGQEVGTVRIDSNPETTTPTDPPTEQPSAPRIPGFTITATIAALVVVVLMNQASRTV